jgi:hypothetical protein
MTARFAFGIVIAGNCRLRMMSTVNRYRGATGDAGDGPDALEGI